MQPGRAPEQPRRRLPSDWATYFICINFASEHRAAIRRSRWGRLYLPPLVRGRRTHKAARRPADARARSSPPSAEAPAAVSREGRHQATVPARQDRIVRRTVATRIVEGPTPPNERRHRRLTPHPSTHARRQIAQTTALQRAAPRLHSRQAQSWRRGTSPFDQETASGLSQSRTEPSPSRSRRFVRSLLRR